MITNTADFGVGLPPTFRQNESLNTESAAAVPVIKITQGEPVEHVPQFIKDEPALSEHLNRVANIQKRKMEQQHFQPQQLTEVIAFDFRVSQPSDVYTEEQQLAVATRFLAKLESILQKYE